MDKFKIPKGTTIGHVHLKVSNLEQSLEFYCGLLGFELMNRMGDSAAFIAADQYHHHIGLNTWTSLGGKQPPIHSTGLFHVAIRFERREDLSLLLRRLKSVNYPITGAADHGVSESLYLNDPDKNGIELYWDKPQAEWPNNEDGSTMMYTRALDLDELVTL
jgi:catechol 2,3-dioxygenase